MALAHELQADYVCIDDLPARRKAQRLGLQVIGTVGVLQLAYRSGYLPARTFSRYLDDLTQIHGMYLSPEILCKLKEPLRDIH
jgi:predicted nucleic acid-binding protein